MDRITVNGSSKYDVFIKQGAINVIGQLLQKELGGERACIVTDSNVAALYLDTLCDSLSSSGYDVCSFVLPAGEASKSMTNYQSLLEFLAEHEFERSDLLLALGGGMIGDLSGFAASSFKRGMRLVQLPTSLLAAVDSSIGGKTAINLPLAKNQVGTFYNPSIVICDPNTLNTLPSHNRLEGFAEILKYGILSGYEIIDALRKARNVITGLSDFSEVISQAVRVKRDIVEMDEKDNSFRQYLNLGHLVGHAIEALSGYSISHGQAVAEGLAIEAKTCALYGFTSFSTYVEIVSLLEEFGFDVSAGYRVDELLPYILKDKRLNKGSINIIVPVRIGECTMKELPIKNLEEFLTRGL